MTIETRNLCKRCRLSKCYLIGMKKVCCRTEKQCTNINTNCFKEMVLEKRSRKDAKPKTHSLPPSPPPTPSDEGAHCSPSSARHSPVSTDAVEEVIWRDLVHFFKEEKEDESTISSNSCKEVKPKVSTGGGDQATFHLEKLFNQGENRWKHSHLLTFLSFSNSREWSDEERGA